MARFKTLDDLPEDLTGKRVLVRVDLNVPMDGADIYKARWQVAGAEPIEEAGESLQLDGSAIRVPVPDGSLIDLTFTPKRDTTRDEVNQILKAASQSERLKGVLVYSDEPLVSVDIVHTPQSSTIDSLETAVLEGKLVRVVSWYDNEWGFSNRMVDTAAAIGKLG